MVARPLLQRLAAVRGEVDLTVLRPPTFDALRQAVTQAAHAGEPFHVVHFDGHGVMPGGGAAVGGRPVMMGNPSEGLLAFEGAMGGSDLVMASKVAAVLAEGKVPVMVLNACQSGAIGKELEASVATALLNAGCAAVVGMAYSVYAVAAAEFMAVFYERLFAGSTLGQAVTAGRRRLFEHERRPSPKGDMPLADWLIPVHYMRKEVRFPQARTPARPGRRRWMRRWTSSGTPSLSQKPGPVPWPRWTACSWAGMTCSTSWRRRPGCSEWWCCLVLGGRGRRSWRRGSRAGGGTLTGWMTRGWCAGILSSPELPASA